MSTSLQPDQNIPASSQPSPDSGVPSPQEALTQPTPPTNQPAAQPTKSKYEEILEATLREQNARIQQMDADLRAARQAPAPTPTPEQPKNAADFFNDPHGVLADYRRQINEDMQKTIAPLLEIGRNLRGDGTPYGNLKQQFQNDPRYSTTLSDPKVAIAVDKIMENQQPIPELMKAAIIQAAGLKMTGELDVALVSSGVDISRFNQPAPTPTPTPTTAPVPSMPAHMRPSAPSSPTPQSNAPAVVPLTALEKRLMNERGMTEEQFRAWMTVPPSEVATSTIGKPVQGGNNGR